MHIHVGQSFFSRLAVGKMLYFINSKQNEKFLDLVSGRKQTHYCYGNSSLKIKDVKTYRDRDVKNLIMFEPQKHCYDQIVKEAKLLGMTDIKLVNKALGNVVEEKEIVSDPTGLTGSLLKPKEVYNFPDLDQSK